MVSNNALNNIPQEMRIFRQWVVWRYEDTDGPKPTKVPYSALNGRLASVTDPNTWASFDEAAHALQNSGMYSGIGFVLTEADPFAFIDLDDTKGDQTALDRQVKIFNEFDSYAERSPSGSGLHIIVKGALPSGRRRSHIEVYSSARYMTMTGDIYRNAPIREYNELLNVLWSQMGSGSVAAAVYAGVAEAKESDEEVLARATAAANGQKFADLYAGRWQDYYPSQSEADFALVDIIAFYTQNRAQISRMFRASGLGQREKGKRVDYVNYMLNKCFDRMLPPVDIDGLRNQLNEAIEAKAKAEQSRAMARSDATQQTPQPVAIPAPTTNVYSVPPGLVGEIAQFIYAAAPRPVAEIALAGALGFLAGIVGRAYNVSGTGLNQYVLLLAPTGTGKEAIASGVDKLMAQVIRTVPAAVDFIGPGEIASSQAVIKYMSKGPTSFVSMVGEFGIYLQQMAAANAPPHLMGLRRFLLDAYNKSGEGKVLRPSIYSDKEKNTAAVTAPAFTLLGESTPEKFYEGLHEGLISEGLLPRFTTIEYHGDRPPLNPNHIYAQPSFELIDRLSTVCAHALMLNSQHKAVRVQFTPEAKAMFDEFDKHCDLNINGSDREVRRHLWNRAHIKAMKLAALVAVGCNPYDPIVTIDGATWATNLIVADVRNLLDRFNAGEIGIDNEETRQLAELIKIIKEYVLSPWSEVSRYKAGSAQMHGEKVVPYSYLHKRATKLSTFRKDRIGETGALKRAIKTLTERGDIQQLSPKLAHDNFKTSAQCFMISNANAFGL